MNLRKLAQGKPCQVRLPGCISGGDNATTVLAHYRLLPYCGTGIKPDDYTFGAWACAYCHDLCDSRRDRAMFDLSEIRLAHAEGVMRTQMQLREMGVRK